MGCMLSRVTSDGYPGFLHLGGTIRKGQMTNQQLSISYQENKIFKFGIYDLLGVSVDTIVNPANSGLSHGGGLAAIISEEAGPSLDKHCEKYIEKYGRIPVTKAVASTAGRLPYKCVIHAVGPRMGDGDEQKKIEATIMNSLTIAHTMGWESVAFPAISTGLFMVPKEVCAQAFKRAVTSFWGKYRDTSVHLIWLCLTIDDYPVFKKKIKPE